MLSTQAFAYLNELTYPCNNVNRACRDIGYSHFVFQEAINLKHFTKEASDTSLCSPYSGTWCVRTTGRPHSQSPCFSWVCWWAPSFRGSSQTGKVGVYLLQLQGTKARSKEHVCAWLLTSDGSVISSQGFAFEKKKKLCL